jgi:hypothetical protein
MFPVKFLIDLGSDDLDRIVSKVADIYMIKVDDISLKGKRQKRIKASNLFFCWAVRELGISLTELGRR